MCHGMGHDPARTRCGFEPPGSPAAVDVQALDRREPDDGAGIGRHIDDARHRQRRGRDRRRDGSRRSDLRQGSWGEHRAAVREGRGEGAHDAAQCRQVQLVQRQPLAEQAAGGQAFAHGGEVFARVEEGGAVLGRMKKVGHDDIVAVRRGADEPAGIGGEVLAFGAGRELEESGRGVVDLDLSGPAGRRPVADERPRVAGDLGDRAGRAVAATASTERPMLVPTLVEALDRVLAATPRPNDLELLRELSRKMADTALCRLESRVPGPMLTTLDRFEGEYRAHAERGEVTKGISLLEYYAGEGFRMGGKTLPSESRDTFTYTIRQPLGCVGLIAPWNFPWAIPVWKSAPALVAGQAAGDLREGIEVARRAITMTRLARYSGVPFWSRIIVPGSIPQPAKASAWKSFVSAASKSVARNTPFAPAPVTATRTFVPVLEMKTPAMEKRDAGLRNFA